MHTLAPLVFRRLVHTFHPWRALQCEGIKLFEIVSFFIGDFFTILKNIRLLIVLWTYLFYLVVLHLC